MKLSKIISTALVLATVLASLVFMTTAASAAIYTNADKVDENGDPIIDYTAKTAAYATREEKLADMEEIKTVGDYRIWYESFTGEVAIEELSTGDILFTNPYDISDTYCKASATTKEQLLSQLIITYLDNEELKTMYSYEEAAMRSQIVMKDIKNGIRVEYAIGEEAIQRLVPRMTNVDRFQKYIIDPFEKAVADGVDGAEFAYQKFMTFYELKDINARGLSERQMKEMQKAFPIVNQMAVYVCETKISAQELKRLEGYVKKYCPQYTYEELDFDNQQTGFKNTDQIPPRFTMALEYTICDDGVEVTLPANGISFDETLYQLQDVTVLPYMGAGSNQYTGYTFLPDGSGAIFRYEDLKDTIYNVSGKIYGADYAYHEIEGANAETMRFPVFGAVTNYSDPTDPKIEENKIYKDSGFLAIITEGDALATITTNHGGALHPYNSVYATFTPRPSDTYNLADNSSGLDSAEWTVTSSRRYTGSYKIRYVMLSGKDSSNGGYDPTYFGMAAAYRDYLSSAGQLEKLSSSNEQLPLYIESFGSMKGTKRVLSFPVTIDVPLTTFEDIKTMTNELSEAGINNISYKMTGFANGGLDSSAPIKLSWQSVLGGGSGFKDLVAYAAEHGITLYPDFDFAYINERDTFDGVNLKSQAVRTIDGRYTRKQVYDSGYQMFQPVGGPAVSASVFESFWDKFGKRYNDYGNGAISLSTLGSDLNSDFDKNEPYHREDTKEYTEEFLSTVGETNRIMLSGGNAYALKYANVVTNVPLTSSDYIRASETVPFSGIVLHGSKQITGTPINMEGDIGSAVLSSIENGASPFFTLSYENTQNLKSDDYWSQYYSIAYDIWKEDVIRYYGILNDAIGTLQGSYISEHDFLDGYRVPDEDELAADRAAEAEVQKRNEEGTAAAEERYRLAQIRAKRLGTAEPSKYDYRYETETIDTQSKYKTQGGSVVLVGYEEGTKFILNYNSYAITVEYGGQQYQIEAMGFVKLG